MFRGRVPIYAELPELISGFEQDRYTIKLVKPLTKTNLATNPSFETNTTGISAISGGAIARSSTFQRRGVYSLQYTPTSNTTDGIIYTPVSLTAGVAYYWTFDFLGPAGISFDAYFATAANAQLGTKLVFVATGQWQRLTVPYNEVTTATDRRWIIRKTNSATLAPFYVDGVQIEQDQATSYLDGSMRGFVRNQTAYYWNGAEHSSTSTRVQDTRSGGQELNLKDYGFKVMAILGLGGNNFSNQGTENAFMGGAIYERSTQLPGKFDIVGAFFGSLSEMMRNKSDLLSALQYNAGIVHQPMLVKIQVNDECGDPIGHPIEIECLYSPSGMGDVRDNYNQERTALSFETFKPVPMRMDGDVGAALNYETTIPVAATHALLRRNGLWQTPAGVAFNSDVKAIAWDEVRGRIYFGGVFTNAGGNAGADFICYLDLATNAIVAMDAGTNQRIDTIAIAPNGDVYIGGAFTTVGSAVAAAKGFARWNIATGTWTAFNPSTTTFTNINSIAIFYNGFYALLGGNFTDYAAAANDYLAVFNITSGSIESIADTPNDIVRTISPILGTPLSAYIGGRFTTPEVRLARVDVVSLSPLGPASGANGEVIAFAVGSDGKLYAGGAFTVIGGVTVAGIAVFNGVAWEPLGTGVAGGNVDSLFFGPDGILYAGGSFTSAGGVPNTAFWAGWNGSTWFPIDVNLNVASQVVRAVTFVGTDLYIGFDSDVTGTTAAGITTVNHPGSADVYPIITITGPGTVWTLRNYTTGDLLFFNLILSAGEVATLDFTLGSLRFYSTFRPNLLGTILSGSSYNFKLARGSNIISLFLTGDTAATAAIIKIVPTFASLDDTLYR